MKKKKKTFQTMKIPVEDLLSLWNANGILMNSNFRDYFGHNYIFYSQRRQLM